MMNPNHDHIMWLETQDKGTSAANTTYHRMKGNVKSIGVELDRRNIAQVIKNGIKATGYVFFVVLMRVMGLVGAEQIFQFQAWADWLVDMTTFTENDKVIKDIRQGVWLTQYFDTWSTGKQKKSKSFQTKISQMSGLGNYHMQSSNNNNNSNTNNTIYHNNNNDNARKRLDFSGFPVKFPVNMTTLPIDINNTNQSLSLSSDFCAQEPPNKKRKLASTATAADNYIAVVFPTDNPSSGAAMPAVSFEYKQWNGEKVSTFFRRFIKSNIDIEGNITGQGIVGTDLPDLTEQTLHTLGIINFRERKTIIDEIRKLVSGDNIQPQPLQPTQRHNIISATNNNCSSPMISKPAAHTINTPTNTSTLKFTIPQHSKKKNKRNYNVFAKNSDKKKLPWYENDDELKQIANICETDKKKYRIVKKLLNNQTFLTAKQNDESLSKLSAVDIGGLVLYLNQQEMNEKEIQQWVVDSLGFKCDKGIRLNNSRSYGVIEGGGQGNDMYFIKDGDVSTKYYNVLSKMVERNAFLNELKKKKEAQEKKEEQQI